MHCNHKHTVRMSWVGFAGKRVVVSACDDCGKKVWDELAQPLRETFVCEAVDAGS